MVRDAILANKVGISYPRQLEMIHGAIERILNILKSLKLSFGDFFVCKKLSAMCLWSFYGWDKTLIF